MIHKSFLIFFLLEQIFYLLKISELKKLFDKRALTGTIVISSVIIKQYLSLMIKELKSS